MTLRPVARAQRRISSSSCAFTSGCLSIASPGIVQSMATTLRFVKSSPSGTSHVLMYGSITIVQSGYFSLSQSESCIVKWLHRSGDASPERPILRS